MNVIRKEKPLSCLEPLEEILKMLAKADELVKISERIDRILEDVTDRRMRNDLVLSSSLARGVAIKIRAGSGFSGLSGC